MKTRSFTHVINAIASLFKTAVALRLLALSMAMTFLLPSIAAAADTDLGNVDRVDVDGNNADNVNYYQGNKGVPWHLFKRADGTYYLKSKGVYGEITGATVKTSTGTYVIPDKTNDQRVDNFNNDVGLFVKQAIASLPGSSPASGDSFYPLNLSTALAMEGNNSGLWEDNFISTSGVVGFEMASNELSLLGSSTADGSTPIVYSFDASTESWSLNVNGGTTQFTFADGTGLQAGPDFTSGWVFGTAAPEPSSLLLLGSGILGLTSVLRKRRAVSS